jgi:NADH-quinone oxidoreductase subunit H
VGATINEILLRTWLWLSGWFVDGLSHADYSQAVLESRTDWIVGYVIAALLQCGLILQVIAVGALVFIWMERKIAGRIQDRLGPTRIGGSFGWLQTLADGIKLIAKEDVTPAGADWVLFKFSPYLSFAASFAAFLALPFATGWVAQNINTAAFFVLAVLGLEVFGVILAGYASGSKWSLFGGMREAAQVVSYEVPLGICVIIPIMIAGTMNLTTIANMQAGLFTNWFIFHDPFTFCTFWVYFTCAVASVNRAPFDLAEAESELVAGFHTEYSGLRWSFFFMAEYGSMFLVSGLATILFFGGWNGPIPIFYETGLAYQESAMNFSWGGALANVFGCINFILKAVIGVTVMMWVRWTFPRLRIDQVISTCLKYCVPLASVGFVGVLFWQALGIPFINDIAPANYPGQVREQWVLEAEAATKSQLETAEKPVEAEADKPQKNVDDTKPADQVALADDLDRQSQPATKGGR